MVSASADVDGRWLIAHTHTHTHTHAHTRPAHFHTRARTFVRSFVRSVCLCLNLYLSGSSLPLLCLSLLCHSTTLPLSSLSLSHIRVLTHSSEGRALHLTDITSVDASFYHSRGRCTQQAMFISNIIVFALRTTHQGRRTADARALRLGPHRTRHALRSRARQRTLRRKES